MSEHIEMEVGLELDRALRSAVLVTGQVLERGARRRQDEDRARTSAERDQARELEQVRRQLDQAAREQQRREESKERDQARRAEMQARDQAREQQQTTRDAQRQQEFAARDQQHTARQEWLDERTAARGAYGKWTRDGAVERGDRLGASKAWERAASWAGQDVVAREAAQDLHSRIVERFGADPAAILRSVDAENGYGTGVAVGRMNVAEAAQLADQHAPFYYDGHQGLGRVARDGAPATKRQEAVVADMQAWAVEGQVPLQSRMASWARHIGQGEILDAQRWTRADGAVDTVGAQDQLATLWSQTAGQRSYEELGNHIRTMRSEDMSTEQVAQAIAGVLPRSGDYGPLLEREALAGATDEQVLSAFCDSRLDATNDAPHVTEHYRAVALDASEQFDRELRRRWGTSPAAHLGDVMSDLRVAHTDARRTQEDQEYAHRDSDTISFIPPVQYSAAQAQSRDLPSLGEETVAVTRPAQHDRDQLATTAIPTGLEQVDQEVLTPAAAPDNDVALNADLGAPATVPPERGVAPSKATTEGERAHRQRAWAIAQRDFKTDLAEGTPSRQADQAWRDLDRKDQFGRYWSAYDSAEARGDEVDIAPRRDADAPATSAPTAQPQTPVLSSENRAPQTQISRDRVLELNEKAATWFQARMTAGSPGHDYVTGRVGQDTVDAGTFRFGYAPPGWRHLSQHLRADGASDQEIVASGLGRVSSRGSVIDVFRDRATVAIRDDDGAVLGFVGRDLSTDPRAPKYLNTGQTPAYRKGDHMFGLYEAGANSTADKARLVRVEGPFDAVAVTAAGEGHIHGVSPLGTELSNHQVDKLAAVARDRTVWVGNDRDAAGQRATAADFWKLREHNLDARVIQWPAGKDPAELWATDRAQLQQALQSPDVAPSAGMVVLDEAIELDRDGLLDGDVEAFQRVEYARMDVENAMSNDMDRDLLKSHVDNRLGSLRDEQRVEELQQAQQQTHAAAEQPTGPAQHEHLGEATAGLRGQEHDARSEQTGASDHEAITSEIPQDRPAVYDRASESHLHALSDEAWEARTASSGSFTRSTKEMLNESGHATGQHAKQSRPGEHTVDRSKNFQR